MTTTLSTIGSAIILLFIVALMLYIFGRLKMPTIVGFLFAGVVLGPDMLGIIGEDSVSHVISELGAIALLFTIGAEFSLRHLLKIRKVAIIGGLIQIGITMAVFFLAALAYGISPPGALVVGMLVSLSSTAIVLKSLQQREEAGTPQGNIMLGILVLQDLIIIPYTVIFMLLGGNFTSSWDIVLMVGKVIGALAVLLLAGRYIIPRLIGRCIEVGGQELQIFVTVLICFSTAWLMHSVGLSFALGAFLAGVVFASTEYNHHVLSQFIPFRDLFSGFFFVSIGLLFNFNYLFSHLLLVLFFAFIIIIGKALASFIAVHTLGYSTRLSIVCGFGLAQVGEFSFVLLNEGTRMGIMTSDITNLFIASALLTMAITPFLLGWSGLFSQSELCMRFCRLLDKGWRGYGEMDSDILENHVIIVGYGSAGRNLVDALKSFGIRYIIVEISPTRFRDAKEAGEPVIFGDGRDGKILHAAGINEARILFAGCSSLEASLHVTKTAAELNPSVHIIARTRYLKNAIVLRNAGAHEIITEEFEVSLEVLDSLLYNYLIPGDLIEDVIEEMREQQMLTLSEFPQNYDKRNWERMLSSLQVESYQVMPGSDVEGKLLNQLALGSEYGITLAAAMRGELVYPNPRGSFKLEAGDIIVLLGRPSKLNDAEELFR